MAVSFETGHQEMIHDAQFDYYGKKLATASSDRSIRIFDVAGDKQTLCATLTGHDGPVWQVSWAHPKFGSLLASCSYDGRVVVWKEQNANQFVKIFEDTRSESSINSISWAPHTFGLCLVAGSADGTIYVFTRNENNSWDCKSFLGHNGGVTAVSWGPDLKASATQGQQQSGQAQVRFERRFVSSGCDNQLRLWRLDQINEWVPEPFTEEKVHHNDWVRDVAWAPSIGLPANTIASCSEDKTVIIWRENSQTGRFTKIATLPFEHKVWRVSWSVMGNILAVSQGDNQVSLWKEQVDGKWARFSENIQDEQKEKVPQ